MLVSDPMSGQLHEVPDEPSLAGWYGWGEAEPLTLGYGATGEPEVFDGFGNPLGLAPLLAALIPAAASVLPGLLKGLFGGQSGGGLGMWHPGLGGYEAVDFDGWGYPYGSQVVFDGYGNPIGEVPLLQSILPAATGVLQQMLPAISRANPQVGSVIQQVLPHAQQAFQALQSGPAMAPPMPGGPLPPMGAPPPPMPMDMESEPDGLEPDGPPGPPMPSYPPPPAMPGMMRRRSMRRRSYRGRRGRRF